MEIVRYGIVGALALALAGCSGISAIETAVGTSVTPNQVYIGGNAVVALETAWTQYDLLPPCPNSTGLCRTPAGVKAVDKAGRALAAAATAVEAYATANPGSVVPVSLYNTLTASFNALQ